MTFLDLLTIYLAIGAPFGVHRYLSARKSGLVSSIIPAISGFVFWLPVAVGFGLKSLNNFLSKTDFDDEAKTDSEIDAIVLELEAIVRRRTDSRNNSAKILESKEVINRYVGLTLAADTDPADHLPMFSEFFARAGHPDPDLAAICFGRRNSGRLRSHQRRSQIDFYDLAREFADPSDSSVGFVNAAFLLSKLLNDVRMFDLLDSMPGCPSLPEPGVATTTERFTPDPAPLRF